MHTARAATRTDLAVTPGQAARESLLNDPFLPFVKSGMRPGLSRIRRLLDRMDHPERSFESVLVTGSNGKGTTCAVLASSLEHLGWTTGLFTSPHLISVRERFRVNGRVAPQAAMHRFLKLHGGACHRLGATYFETTTAFALWWFRERKVEWAVLEIGLGGRLDACNAVDPKLSIVTSVSLEHTAYLGPTQTHIAAEKGGVARRHTPTFVGPLGSSAMRSLSRAVRAREGVLVCTGKDLRVSRVQSKLQGSRFTLHALGRQVDLHVPFAGGRAVVNAALAASAAVYICSTDHSGRDLTRWKRGLKRGVRAAHLSARLERVRVTPPIFVDVAHNEASVASLVDDWRRLWPGRKPVLLTGLLDDKPAKKIGRLLARVSDTAVLTRPDSPRAVAPLELARTWRGLFRRVDVVEPPGRALVRARELAGKQPLLVTGSHFVVGPVLAKLGRPGRRKL